MSYCTGFTVIDCILLEFCVLFRACACKYPIYLSIYLSNYLSLYLFLSISPSYIYIYIYIYILFNEVKATHFADDTHLSYASKKLSLNSVLKQKMY